eukprot:1093353-Pelagomonas_calceolata.AAC.2
MSGQERPVRPCSSLPWKSPFLGKPSPIIPKAEGCVMSTLLYGMYAYLWTRCVCACVCFMLHLSSSQFNQREQASASPTMRGPVGWSHPPVTLCSCLSAPIMNGGEGGDGEV